MQADTDEIIPRQDIHEQRATYEKFVWATKWAMVLHAAGGAFLVLWFATGAGFLGAAITGVVILALGIAWLRRGWTAEHPSHGHPHPSGLN